MANPEHVKIIKQGVEAWNKWRDYNDEIKPDISGAILCRANLSGANLSKADLSGADLREADLGEANLTRANLTAADLSLSYLIKANFTEANLNGAKLQGSRLIGANLRGSTLCGSNLQAVQLIETDLSGADLTGSKVYGLSAWNLKFNKDTKQLGLVITAKDEPIINVDDIEVAQFIYLLIRHEKLRKIVNSVAEKSVLILGRFGGGGIEVLRAVAEKLREMKYLPIIFDFARPRDRNFTETIKTLAGLSRFIIVDLSGPSVPQELYATVPHFKIPFVPILEKNRRHYAMFADLLEYDWVIKPIVEFDTKESLINSIPSEVVKQAEKRIEKRQRLLLELLGE